MVSKSCPLWRGLGPHCVVPLEGAHFGVERAGAIKLSDLPDVTEIMKGPFIHQLAHGDLAEFGMAPGARGDSGWKVAQPGECPVALVTKPLELLARRAAGVVPGGVRGILIVALMEGQINLLRSFSACARGTSPRSRLSAPTPR